MPAGSGSLMSASMRIVVPVAVVGVLAAAAFALLLSRSSVLPLAEQQAFIDQYCTDCHNAADFSGELDLTRADLDDLALDRDTWEKVVRKLDVGMMPPPEARRPPAEL